MKISSFRITCVLGIALVALNPHCAWADTTIETTSVWNGSDGVGSFGEPNTATYGQTITVPGGDSVLSSFSFWIDDLNTDPDAVDFAAYVMAWDGTKATGPILYQSAQVTTTNNGGAGGYEKFTFNTGGLPLVAGSQYVIFISASSYFDTVTGRSNVGVIGNDIFNGPSAYAGGNFVFYNNGSNFSLLTSHAWDYTGNGPDLAFEAVFSPGPVCATVPPNMIAWWRGDGNGDDSVGGHNGSLMAGTTFAAGEVNQAFSLDGNGAHIDVGEIDLPATFTIDAWVNVAAFTDAGAIISGDDTQNGYSFFVTENGALAAQVYSDSAATVYRTSDGVISAGTWYHVAITYDGTGTAGIGEKIRFYINGVQVPGSASSNEGGDPGPSAFSTKIGVHAASAGLNVFNGLIDEVEVFGRVLDLAEISSIYLAGPLGKCECTPPPSGMISWWPAEGDTNDIQDGNTLAAGNGNGFGYGSGEVGQAFTFDGSQFLTAGTPGNLALTGTTVTIDGWIYPTDAADFSSFVLLFGHAGSGEHDYAVILNGDITGVVKTDVGNPGLEDFVHTGIVPPLNQWTHVALTYDGSNITVYVNGVAAATHAKTGSLIADSPFNIGGRSDCCWYKGAIDEVEVFGVALLPSDIANIYRAGSAGKCRPCTTPPSGMVSWWPGDGNTTDIQGGHNGTLQNGATFAGGKVGAAFSLDGVDDYVSVPDSTDWDFGTDDFTIDLWVEFDQDKRSVFVHQQDGANPGGWEFFYEAADNTLHFNVDPSTNVITRSFTPVVGRWHHLAAVREAGVFRLYADGLQLGSDQANATPAADVTGPLRIGGYAITGIYEHDGLIDELEIFHRALSTAEIAAIYDADSGGKCKPVGPAERQLANISSRVDVGTGENVGIGGFIIRTDPPSGTIGTRGDPGPALITKQVLIRGLGPSLQVEGNPLPGRLLDPVLDLYDSNGALIEHNDNWMEQPDGVSNPARTAAIQGTGLAPSDPNESAILRNLPTDSGYTAILSGKDESSGLALVEVYDLEPTTNTHLGNISTRAFVSTGDSVLIGGFIVEGGNPARMLVRAIGPSLPPSVANRLEDPVLELYDANGALLEQNDDWGNSLEATDIGNILPPGNSKDSAILFTPAPGGYTAIVRGNNPNPTGVALVEAYRVASP